MTMPDTWIVPESGIGNCGLLDARHPGDLVCLRHRLSRSRVHLHAVLVLQGPGGRLAGGACWQRKTPTRLANRHLGLRCGFVLD